MDARYINPFINATLDVLATITNVTKAPIVAVPFSTYNGEFTIEVCFEE